MNYSPRQPYRPIVTVVPSGRGETSLGQFRSWFPVACVTLIQLLIWVYLDRFLYQVQSSPSGHAHGSHSGVDDSVARAIVAVLFIAIVAALPAAATAMAPKRPMLTGLLVSSLPGVVASAEYSRYRLIPGSQDALAAAVMISFAAFIIAVLPTYAIVARLRAVRQQSASQQALYGKLANLTDTSASSSVWPPPPSV